VLVDTGADSVVLSKETAARVGFALHPHDFTGRALTAAGITRYAPVILPSVRIGPISLTEVDGIVNEGESSANLLGLTFLRRLSRIQQQEGRLILRR
jgi:aspartyl protease family protein